jgi:signal transduction histidine kinase
MRPLKPVILCCLVIAGGSSKAQDSSARVLSGLQSAYRDHRLGDTAYMKAVDSIAPVLVNLDSLPRLLSGYQEIAFSDKKWGAYRARYYTYLALYSYNKNRFGSAVYYSERNNEERVEAGMFEKGGLSHSDLFALTVYSNNKDYARVLSRYDSLRPALLRMPAAIAAGTVSPDQASVAFMILNAIVYASCKAKDSVRAAEGVGIGDKMLTAVRQSPQKYRNYLAQYTCFCHLSEFEKERFDGQFGTAGSGSGTAGSGSGTAEYRTAVWRAARLRTADELLHTVIREVGAKGFPPNFQSSYLAFSYTEAFDFYFDQGKIDSARRYFELVKALNDKGISYGNLDPAFLPESNSKLLADAGQFEKAYDELRKVYRMRDSAYYAVSSDKDNNLYAMAMEENTRADLFRTEARRRQAEKFTEFLFALLALLVLGGVGVFTVYRYRQRQKLTMLQLSLARNFHDEIGPMLLYANALVKKETEAHPSPVLEELKAQIATSMEAVRSISHDLKSSRLCTVDSFYKEVSLLLEKIRRTTEIDFVIRLNNGSRILSYWQYSNLKNIVNELIGNSIKHAACGRITILIKAMERQLLICYSDDGKGMKPDIGSQGIGIRNARERAELLKGSFRLDNAWPKGYSIELSIPFV